MRICNEKKRQIEEREFKIIRVRPSLSDTNPETTSRPMFPGAGEAVSRRRWAPPSALLVYFTFVLLYCCFIGFPVRFFLFSGRRRSQRISKQRQVLWFLGVVFPVTPSLRLVSVSALCQEDSLTTVLVRFTASLPVEPTSGCRRSSHDFDSVQASQPPMELNFQPKSSLFPSMGRPEPNISLWSAPLQSYGTRSTSFMRLDLNFIGNSSISPPLKVKLYSQAYILSNDCTVHLRRSLSGVYSDTELPFKSRSGVYPSNSTGKCELSVHFVWTWPISVTKSGSQSFIFPEPRGIKVMIMSLLISDGWDILSEIPGFCSCILPYFSNGIIFQVDSPGLGLTTEYLLTPYFLSMKEDVSLVLLPSISFSFFTGLPSCVAVCTGPEDATEITSVFFVGECWLSTSPLCVTISQLSNFVVKALSTQSSFVLISQSSSHEELSILTYFA